MQQLNKIVFLHFSPIFSFGECLPILKIGSDFIQLNRKFVELHFLYPNYRKRIVYMNYYERPPQHGRSTDRQLGANQCL